MNVDDQDKSRGLYSKFHVTRTDGSSKKGKKHASCQYFVLDVDHDPHAYAALLAYADSCKKDFPALAADLQALAAYNDAKVTGGTRGG